MRLLHLVWPHLPLRLHLERLGQSSSPDEPLILGGQPWDAGSVLDANPAALRLGVRRGQPLGSAHKLVPEATFLVPERERYRDAFERALDALTTFAPAVEGEPDPDHERFGHAWVGIEGLERLWGDERRLLRRIVLALAPLLPGVPRVGIANTRFGAGVAARTADRTLPLPGDPPRVVRCGAIPPGAAEVERAALAPHPIGLLTDDPELQARFTLFGLTRIGDLARLPRSAVVARFGEEGGSLHDLASGLDGRPLVPRRPVEHLRADAELEPPAEQLETLRFVLRHLTETLCAQLAARGSGAARAIVSLELERGDPIRLEQAMPEPVAIPALIERVLVGRLETLRDLAPVTRLALELSGTAPAAGQQLSLFSPRAGNAARLEWQLAGLALRYGGDRLLRARISDPEARLAEERIAWLPFGTAEPA